MIYDAIVLTGGSGRRLGGVDKAALVVDEVRLLDRVLEALQDARRVVVVGPECDTARPVRWTREEPAGTGPMAAIAAGLEHVSAPVVAILAVDLPFVTCETVTRLVGACDRDGAVAVDDGGKEQPLLAAYRTESLRSAIDRAGDVKGVAVRAIVEGLDMSEVHAPEASFDIDSPADLAGIRPGGTT